MEIRVISGDKDGAELRRETYKNQHYVRCDGTRDNDEINDAIETSSKGQPFLGLGESWERIFGGK